jgi:hypothetical protein
MADEKRSNPESPPEPDDEFERFERLTQSLLTVPKQAIDAERRKREGAKRKRVT